MISSGVAVSSISRISYGLHAQVIAKNQLKDITAKMKFDTHLSFNAFSMRSTSSSRWKADASRLRSFSSSASEIAGAGVVDDLEAGSCTDIDLVGSFV